MSEQIFVVERNEISAQIRLRLQTSTVGIADLSNASDELEKKTSELRELDQRLKQLQQNVFALQRGSELRDRRDQLLQTKEKIEKRLEGITAERTSLETKLHELKREEANQNEIVQRIKKGKDLHSLAQAYREAVAEIKQGAAVQLREQVSQIVGELWLDITERGDEFLGMEFDQLWSCYLLRREGRRIFSARERASKGTLSYVRDVGNQALFVGELGQNEYASISAGWESSWPNANREWRKVDSVDVWRCGGALFAIGGQNLEGINVR